MKNIYILSGISGSGKSTWTKTHHPDAIYLNADSIRHEIYGDENVQGEGAKIFGILFGRVKNALRGDKDIVIDNTSPTFKDRKAYYDLITNTEDKVHLVSFVPNLKRAKEWNKKRTRQVPDEVIDRQFNKFAGPTEWERENVNIIEVH